MRKGPVGWVVAAWRFVVDVALRWYHGRVGDLAASVTFWIVISLPALVLSLLAVLGPLDELVNLGFQETIEDRLVEFVDRVFTDENLTVRDTINGLFNQTNNNLLIVSVGLAVWSISRGFSGLIRALEDIYDIEDRRPWYYTRVVAVILGIGSILISVPLVLIEIYVWAEIDDGLVESTLRGLVAILVLILWASIVYHYGPAERHRWRFDLPGAVVAAVLWWVLSWGFARYVEFAETANAVRSAFGAVLLALTWIWLAAQVLLIGGAVNHILGQRLGVARGRRAWTVTEVVTKSTGEIRKIVVPERDDPGGRMDEEPEQPPVLPEQQPALAERQPPAPEDDPRAKPDPVPDPSADQPSGPIRIELDEPPRNGAPQQRSQTRR
ncbi:MAG: YhjD/YihY/BrkB family envelope integrity protein [Actinomycetota bacterium]